MLSPTNMMPSSFSLRPNNSDVKASVISKIDNESSTEPVPVVFKYSRYSILYGYTVHYLSIVLRLYVYPIFNSFSNI